MKEFVSRLWDRIRALGGPGSGHHRHEGRPGHEGGSTPDEGEGSGSRSERAARTHKPSTRAKQREARRQVQILADRTGGEPTPDHEAMDLILKRGAKTVGVEMKTLLDNKNDKITMHPDSRRRKEKWIRQNRADGYTVVVDRRRGKEGDYYYREGFGSFRISAMIPITPTALTRLLTRGGR
jgi:hypothetical protein